jgi:DNA repair protein RadC
MFDHLGENKMILNINYEDILLTKRLCQAGEILGINVLDHVIVGGEGTYFSFRDNGMISQA